MNTEPLRVTSFGTYSFHRKFYGISIHDWVHICNKRMGAVKRGQIRCLHAGTYGYDSTVVILYYLFDAMEKNGNLAAAVHAGWLDNYKHWTLERPWKKDDRYKPPVRRLCMKFYEKINVPYDELPGHIREKRELIVAIVRNIISIYQN